jgi:hypothetical protein
MSCFSVLTPQVVPSGLRFSLRAEVLIIFEAPVVINLKGRHMKTNKPVSLESIWYMMGGGAIIALGLVAAVWGVLGIFVA